LISGKELVKKISPLELYTETEKVTRKQAPIVKAIQDMPAPLSLTDMEQTIRDPLVTAIRALPQPPTARAIRDAMTDGMQIPPIEYRDEEGATAADIEEKEAKPKQRGLEYNPDADLDFKILEKYKLTKPSALLEQYAAGGNLNLDERIKYVDKNITNAQARKRTAVKSQDPQKEAVEKDIETTLKNYRDELRTIKKKEPKLKVTGKGLKKLIYGKYTIDKKKLGKGILSISYPNGKKVPGYPNMKVSDAVKKVFMNNKINKHYNLSKTEKTFIRDFINRSEAEISKSKSKAVCNKSFNRMAVLLGEMNAGNSSLVVKNELADIAHHFYKNKQLDKDQYSKILNLI